MITLKIPTTEYFVDYKQLFFSLDDYAINLIQLTVKKRESILILDVRDKCD